MIYSLQDIETNRDSFSMVIPSFQFEEGLIHCITGSNGCGKSTLLDLLAMLRPPSKGTVDFKGAPVSFSHSETLIAQRRRIGYLTQSPYLFNMSVRNNISYGLKLRGHSRKTIRERTDLMLANLFLMDLADRPAHSLSGGEAQRVALARTLVLGADVYLLDEPTTNVDRQNIPIVEDLIKCLNTNEGATVILSTHSHEQARRFSDSLISMEDGEIINVGNNTSPTQAKE